MAINQYRDLPQIQGYYIWPVDHEYHLPTYKQTIMGLEPISDYSDDSDNGLVNLQPMQRFRHDQGPFHPQTPVTKTPSSSPIEKNYAQQWHFVDMARTLSPECSSTSGFSSHASHCELRSSPMYHPDLYSGSKECPQSQHSYPSTEPFEIGSYLLGTSISHTVVNPRELEIERPVLQPEAGGEEVEGIQDATFEQEMNYNQDTLTSNSDTCSTRTHYAASGIRHSARDAESVQPVDDQEGPASDSDYNPFNRSSKRKRSSASTRGLGRATRRRVHKRKDSFVSSSLHSTKRNRQTSNAPRSSPKTINSIEERRHFPCPLAPYGCESEFASKNEWKRHVSTQHIKTAFWRCDICAPTSDPKDKDSLYHNDFNRMDLFRQHLRRMHARPKDKLARSHADYPVNEANLADHQTRCFSKLRKAPQRSSCIFCPKDFSGPNSWADRMDHVGSHLEKDRRVGMNILDISSWRKDPGLEQYLLDEGLIRSKGGEWSIGDGRPRGRAFVESEDNSGKQ
ncbi:hypothetical protein IAQ61_004525 [Plenodomus lingam]|uniref:uncharacterized protein n=1 Tax=Leptosphaeria maculans TaxID=5022 RepID=UPI0033285F08|nr:hypothetical protein IAQ61_004525 [Plenodomus lingam]